MTLWFLHRSLVVSVLCMIIEILLGNWILEPLCVFMGYSPSQKGYRCWCPSEYQFFISMDVTFREHEPYYLGSTNGTGIVLSPPVVGQEGESDSGASLSGSILVPTSGVSSPTPGVSSLDGNLSSQGEERFHNSNDNLSHGDMQDVAGHSSPYSQDVEPCMHEDSGNDDHSPSPVAPTNTIGHSDNQLSTLVLQD